MNQRYNIHYYPSEDKMKSARKYYIKYFCPNGEILDLGCGRGEFLELLRETNRHGQGIETDAGIVNICRQKGLEVIHSDATVFLKSEKDKKWDGIFMGHIIEHLDWKGATELLTLASNRLKRTGRLVVLTPNPHFLPSVGHFWSDMTHRRPYTIDGLKSFLSFTGLRIIEAGVDPATKLRVSWRHPREAIINLARLIILRLVMLEYYDGGEIYVVGEKECE